MPFFMVDDQLFINRKVKKLTAPVLDGDLHGLAAIGLWTLAGSSVQAALTDGLVSIHDLISKVYDITVARKLALLLEDAGLWHANGHDCPRCEPVPANHWRFHDWWALGYDRGDVVRETRAKRKEQQDVEMVAAVWARDCIDPAKPGIARCRYCHKTVKRKDTRSDPLDRPTLDHVDPTSAKGVTNLVVACGDCNRRKGKRTPTEAEMTLRPAPRTTALAATEPAPVTAGTPVSLTVEQAQAAGIPATAEITISPAEEPAVTAARTTSATTSGRPRGNQVVDQAPKGVLGRAHEGAGVGAPGAGSGAGAGVGLDVGTHLG
ncbi:HNH endonuclease [Oerskovia sp. NPDC060338]|uniref:HNH endonuclease n=1 Tax=Oerskovia sp. NPDC060338 TaxID=3347100 RepID=UPI00365F45F3